MKQVFDSSLSFFSGASFGSIYPSLKRCEQHGLVNMRVEIQDGRPNRKVYSITPKGKAAFRKALKENLEISPYRNEFLVRLFFFSHLAAKAREGLTTEYLSYLRRRLARLESLATLAKEKGDPFQLMCYRFGLRHVRHLIENMEQVRQELEEYHG